MSKADAKQMLEQVAGLGKNLSRQKRLAKSILGCGNRYAWLDPTRKKEIALARTRADIRVLIENGLIKKKKPQKPLPLERDLKMKRRLRLRMLRLAVADIEKAKQEAAGFPTEKEGPDLADTPSKEGAVREAELA